MGVKYISMETILYETGRVVGALQKVGDDDEAFYLYDFAVKMGCNPSAMHVEVLLKNLQKYAEAFIHHDYTRVAAFIGVLIDDIETFFYLKPWMNN